MPKITIDDEELEIEEGLSIIQACKKLGKEIPHFCFHSKLSIAGNCRMCLVEVEKSPKLVASCTMPINDGMIIHTNSTKVKAARSGVMELLLINHPLDCPICDQGGECDLQDLAFKYGNGISKFTENKRAVIEKYMGPLISTNMTRCIHCTRCIRFASEIAGIPEIGTIGRGENTEITTYLNSMVTSELSGNLIDLCPVGALTARPLAFTMRKWELSITKSIDILDATCSNIEIATRGLEIMRILPKRNDDINEEWISDKARFSFDGLKNQRLDRPYIKHNGQLIACSWETAINTIKEKINTLNGNEMGAIAGQLACVESMFILKKLFNQLGCNNLDANQHGFTIDKTARANYLFNTTIAGIEKADLCLLIGADPKKVAPIIYARLNKSFTHNNLLIAKIGTIEDHYNNITSLGNNPEIINELIHGMHWFAEKLTAAKYPMIIVGDGILARRDGYILLSKIHELVNKYNIIRDGFNGFNILHNHASMVGSLDIGFTRDHSHNAKWILKQANAGHIKLVYLLGADEIDTNLLTNCFVVYQGHHGDKGASIADVVLPATAYTEKSATYVNLEGRVQLTYPAVPAKGVAKEDWQIINDLANALDIKLEIHSINDLRKELAKFSIIFNNNDKLIDNQFSYITSNDIVEERQLADHIENKVITDIPNNYYMTNVISRNSVTMSKCIAEQKKLIS